MKNSGTKKKREIKEPTKSMADYYGKLFTRNQSKWIRRSKLEPHHLGSEFHFEGDQAKLIGSMNSEEVILHLVNENKFWVVSIDDVTKEILKEVEDLDQN
jgi:hypothetical protein